MICRNCGLNHKWCCARCGCKQRTKARRELDSDYCTDRCETDQQRDDRASALMEEQEQEQ